MKQILKVLIGSQAHGLANENSDYDYRGVFVEPTSELLKIGGSYKETKWEEGKEDDTSWEIGKFLFMATKSNPTILEVFQAPIIEATEEGRELISLFPYVWNKDDVKNAFVGYGLNQRKKFLDDKDNRRNKYAAAYARVLYNAWELLSTESFTIKIADTEVGETIRRFKNGEYEIGEVIDHCIKWEQKVIEAHNQRPEKKTDFDKINEFLLKIRKNNL